jgi:2OG-Fe(II) oxygenase superfamily
MSVLPDLYRSLTARRWWQRSKPFSYFAAENVFEAGFFAEMEAQFQEVLSRGFGEPTDSTRFSRNMPNSDAYSWNLPATVDGPLSLFYSRAWHDMLVALTGVTSTLDVNAAIHHHQIGSANGSVHRDIGIGWFSQQPRPDGINPMDLSRCSYTTGHAFQPGAVAREVVRSLTVLVYLCNPDWQPGEGGETGLYPHSTGAVEEPAVRVPPVNNSILVFENKLDSYHSFISNPRLPRNSAIMWLHRPKKDAVERWGEQSIYRWSAS